MSQLKIRLQQPLGETNDSNVLGNIYNLSPGIEPSDPAFQIRDIIIPVGDFREKNEWKYVDVPPGRYLVEAVLPSGGNVQQEVHMEINQPEHEVVLYGPRSEHEWLSWEVFQSDTLRFKKARLPESGEKRLEFLGVTTPPEHEVAVVLLPKEWPVAAAGTSVPLTSWASLYSLVNTDLDSAQDGIEKIFALVKRPDIGGDVLPVAAAGRDSLVAIRHFSTYKDKNGNYSTAPYLTYLDPKYRRFWAVVSVDGIVREIASLPLPWLKTDRKGEALVDLLIYNKEVAELSRGESADDSLCNIMVRDPKLAGVFGYLASGDLPRALIIASEAKRALLEKAESPLAAAAGGYVLLSRVRTQADTEKEPWHQWIFNLMDWFRWVPDGAVLFGWLRWHAGNHKEARDSFLTAFNRGLPYYSTGVRWLYDGLAMVAEESSKAGNVDDEVENALTMVRMIARQTRMEQPFTTVNVGVL